MAPRLVILLVVLLVGCVDRPPEISTDPTVPDSGTTMADIGPATDADIFPDMQISDASVSRDSGMRSDMTGPDMGADMGAETTVVFQQRVSPTDNYVGSEDTMMRSDLPDSFASDDTDLEADTGNIILLKWDISEIPRGAQVTAAQIDITANSDGGSEMYDVFVVLADWNEAEASWNQRLDAQPWEIAGCQGPSDRAQDALGRIGNSTPYQVMTLPTSRALVTAVQSWVDEPAGNHGITIQREEVDSIDGLHISSSEHQESDYRPRLSVTYRE